MTVSAINNFFGKIGRFQIKYRFPVLAVFLLLTIVCCAGLAKFKIANGTDGWYGDADKIKQDKDLYESTFGNSSSLAILLEADDVFTEEILNVIDRLGERLLELPYADKVTSLIDVDIPVGNEEGFEVVKPYQRGIPSDPAELAEKKAFILRGTEKTNSLINNLVSADGTETWISLKLLPFENPDDDSIDLGYAFHEILKSDEFKSDKYKLYGCGMPYADAMEEEYEIPDAVLRVAIAFAVMIVFLIIFVRTPFGVIIPSITTVGAIASVMGGMAYFGEKADLSLVTLPVLLGIALSIGYSIHYINMFKLHFRQTGNRRESAVKTVEESGWSVFFTVLTTVASLVSFIFVDMKPISWMGKTSALVVLAVYIYVAVLIPICFSFGKNRSPLQKDAVKKGAGKIDLRFAAWADTVKRKKWLIVALSCLLVAVCIPFILKITIKIDMLEMAGTKLPHMIEEKEIISKQIGTRYSYNVMITFEEADSFKEPEKMRALEDFEKFLGTLRLTKISGEKPHVTSVTEILKEMNRALNEGKEEFFSIPYEDYVLAQLMELSSIEMRNDFTDMMNDEFRIANVSVDMTKFESELAISDVRDINAKLAELFPEAKCCIIGDMIEYAEMSTRMVRGELKSFLFSFVVIAIMLIIAFGSIRTGLIGMIPNVMPVILVGGIMGLFGFSLDFVTMTVMPIILGIAVDDTIHLTTHLKYGLEKHGTYLESMRNSFREIGKSMFMTTFILCSIFAVYMFSPIHYLFVIGLLSVTGLGAALLADYTITPALLYIIKPFGAETEKENNITKKEE